MNQDTNRPAMVPYGQYIAQRGRLPYEMAAYLLAPVMHELAEYHGRWETHLDLSPDSIVVNPQTNRAYLLPPRAGGAPGALVTHPGYSPPECYRNDTQKGPAADVYSAMALLYLALFAIQPPDAFMRQENDDVVIQNIAALPLPDDIKAAMTRAFSLQSEFRTQNASQLMQSLQIGYTPDGEYAAMHRTAQSAPSGPVKKKKKAWPFILIGAVAAVAIIAVVLLNTNSSQISEAKKLADQGRYAQAIQKYDDVLFWQDDLNDEYNYAIAGQALQDGNYDKALAVLGNMPDYPGADAMIAEANFQVAQNLIGEGKYGEARLMLGEMSDNENAKTALRSINDTLFLEDLLFGYWETESGYYINHTLDGLASNLPGSIGREGFYDFGDGNLAFYDSDDTPTSAYEVWEVSPDGSSFTLVGLDDGYAYSFFAA